MTLPFRSLLIGLAGLALLAPAAQAGDQVVADPGPGVTSVSISDLVDPGKIVVHAGTPIADGHFSAMFFDVDGDGDGDRAIHVTQEADDGAIRVLATPGSGTSCQQFGGDSAVAITGVHVSFDAGGTGWRVKLPASWLPGDFRWKVTAAAPNADDLCGGTDNLVHGLALGLSDARTFDSGTTAPAPDTTPPTAPAGLTAAPGSTTAVVDWADNAEPDVAGYLVYRRVAGGTFTLVAEPVASRLDDAGLANGTAYEYYVRARDTAGNLSPESARITVVPAAPAVPPEGGDTPPVATPEPVASPPANTKKLVSVGKAQLLERKKAAEKPRFDAATGKVAVGLIYNGESVDSRVSVKFTARVAVKRRGRTVARGAHFRTVVVGRSSVEVAAGEAVPLAFKLNAAGRTLARTGKSLKLTAAVKVKPEGMAARKGSVKVTVKKAAKRKRAERRRS